MTDRADVARAALLVAGVAWLVVFYASKGLYPVGSLRYWNLAVGVGAVTAGAVLPLVRRR